MLLICISWLYVLFTVVNLGCVVDKITRSTSDGIVIYSFKGLFLTSILASFCAVFGRINWEFHSVLLLFNVVVFLKYKPEIKAIYQSFYTSIITLPRTLALFLGINVVLISAQCASIPFLIDNETYYLQTIKWLNEYGFVKGLANLHIFFGQTSGWHIAQSAFNFSFVYNNFNDLSGFCLVLGNLFAILKLNTFFTNHTKTYLIVGLLPIANVLLFQFISAPSPDITVYIISFIVFFYFIENYKNGSSDAFKTMVILVLLMLYCKPTSFLMALLPLSLLVIHFKTLSHQLFSSFTMAVFILGLYITKNTILTGYPLFPLNGWDWNTYDFKVPRELVDFYFNEKRMYRFFLTQEEYQSLSFTQKCAKWFSINTVNGLFNGLSVLLVVTLPWIIKKFVPQKAFWWLYALMIVQLALLLLTSPQYRFFIHFNLFFAFTLATIVVKSKKVIIPLLYLSILPMVITLFFPVNYSRLTHNQLIWKNSTFSKRNVVFPYQNSKLKTTFHTVKNGNLTYYSPDSTTFFWANGNGTLPCVNEVQLNYVGTRFHYIPQQRSEDLSDGFYAKKWLAND
jgi:hypothetical protein